METGQGRRIDWCDIFKGIVIFLVVVGHATSRFNQYIYQFHMAAFFFISGYTGKGRNRGDSVFEEICKKFYKWMVPYYVINFVGIWIFWLFHRTGVLSAVSTTQYPARFQDAFRSLLQGIVYCDWLGAMWFLPVLFLASVLFRILLQLCRRDGVLALASILVFLCGMKLAASGKHFYCIDLAGMAQVYLTAGYLARRFEEGKEGGKVWMLAGQALLAGLAWGAAVQMGFRYTVDWPSRSFNGVVDLILPTFGIFVTICISKLLAHSRFLKKVLVYLGKKSMGVMCFHFIGFKAAYLVLILLGEMEWRDVYRLVPWEVVEDWWLLISVTAAGFSLFLWSMLNRIPVIRMLLGGERAETLYAGVRGTRVVSGIMEVCGFAGGAVQAAFAEYREFLGKKKYVKTAALICAVLAGAGVIAARVSGHIGPIKADFPYNRNIISFQGGWLPQSETEDYRWFGTCGEFQVFLTDQTTLEMQGYIPDDIDHCSYISIRLNENIVYHEPASGGQLIGIALDISEYVERYGVNKFAIETDGLRIPEETDADQRNFSALINSIVIY